MGWEESDQDRAFALGLTDALLGILLGLKAEMGAPSQAAPQNLKAPRAQRQSAVDQSARA